MKLFETTNGFIFSFGFDMLERKPDSRRISWCDPSSKEWESKPTNQAGWLSCWLDIDPEFVIESNGSVIAYQPGLCLCIQYVGPPLVWTFSIMRAESAWRPLYVPSAPSEASVSDEELWPGRP